MLKRWKTIGLIAIIGLGVWYFFIKSYDYKISFKTTQPPGVVYQYLEGWNNWKGYNNNKEVQIFNKSPFSEISQELRLSDSLMIINWEIFRVSDSITKASAFLSDKKNSFIQKLKVPFVKTDFVHNSLSTVKRIQSDLEELKNKYKVGPIEFSKVPKQFCAYISLEAQIEQKANEMMANNYEILTYLQDNNIEIIGRPFLEVTNWNKLKGTLLFNFCFPIEFNENYRNEEDISFKMTEERPALKTSFNGNYRISDCAWFSIIDYAERNGIEVETLPTEIFFNDPHYGGNELDWEAEIYMPIRPQE